MHEDPGVTGAGGRPCYERRFGLEFGLGWNACLAGRSMTRGDIEIWEPAERVRRSSSKWKRNLRREHSFAEVQQLQQSLSCDKPERSSR